MKLDSPPTLSPPWGSVSDWQAANSSIEYHLKRYYLKLEPATQIASGIRSRLESIFTLLDDLGRITCPRCPDICCLSASPWYDMRDLIYLHLNQLPIPRNQTISDMNKTCCYVSHRGCTLARIARPWICTWYLCPTQTANIRKSSAGRWQRLSPLLDEIKGQRKKLEEEFVRVVNVKPQLNVDDHRKSTGLPVEIHRQ